MYKVVVTDHNNSWTKTVMTINADSDYDARVIAAKQVFGCDITLKQTTLTPGQTVFRTPKYRGDFAQTIGSVEVW